MWSLECPGYAGRLRRRRVIAHGTASHGQGTYKAQAATGGGAGCWWHHERIHILFEFSMREEEAAATQSSGALRPRIDYDASPSCLTPSLPGSVLHVYTACVQPSSRGGAQDEVRACDDGASEDWLRSDIQRKELLKSDWVTTPSTLGGCLCEYACEHACETLW